MIRVADSAFHITYPSFKRNKVSVKIPYISLHLGINVLYILLNWNKHTLYLSALE